METSTGGHSLKYLMSASQNGQGRQKAEKV